MRHGGHFLLRFDDTDLERSRPEYEEAIAHDLRWLGIAWDESFRQRDRLDRYAEVAERLKAAGRLYPCFETEEELKAKREARIRRGQPPIYDRAMLRLTPEQRANAEAGGKRPHWRFLLSDGSVEWADLVLGRRQVKLTAVSDPVLIRADGTPLYTFTSAVDDLDTRITHIIRGEDHVTNTGVQLDLLGALGAEPGAIAFAHLPLLVDADGGKLSKRLEGLSLRSLRGDGMEPVALAAYLARLGTSDDPAPLPLAELAATYDLARISHSPARFDMRQLLALNRRVLQSLPFAAAAPRLPAGATEAVLARGARQPRPAVGGARLVGRGGGLDRPAGDRGRGRRSCARRSICCRRNRGTTTCGRAGPARCAKPPVARAARCSTRCGSRSPARIHGPELRELLPLIGRPRAAQRLAVAAA